MIRFVSLHTHELLAAQLRDAHALIGRMAQARARELADVRAQYDAHAIRLLENARADQERADRRYADLMASYRQLKLVGATETPAIQRIEPKPPDKIESAIAAAARGDVRLAAAIRRKVAEDRMQDVPEDEIVQRIQRGSRPAEEWAS